MYLLGLFDVHPMLSQSAWSRRSCCRQLPGVQYVRKKKGAHGRDGFFSVSAVWHAQYVSTTFRRARMYDYPFENASENTAHKFNGHHLAGGGPRGHQHTLTGTPQHPCVQSARNWQPSPRKPAPWGSRQFFLFARQARARTKVSQEPQKLARVGAV